MSVRAVEPTWRGAAPLRGTPFLEKTMKKLLMFLMFVPVLAAPFMGCEAKVDDDSAKVKVDTKK